MNRFFTNSVCFVFKRSTLLLAVLLTFSLTVRSQVATNYTFSQSAGTYTAIAGTIVANAASLNMDDEVFGPITMPAFTFDGITYTNVYICTNGYVTLGAASSTTNYLALSSTENYPAAIAAFSEDLDAAASGTRNIRYQQVGTEFVIQWQNVGRYATNDRISFQIRLNSANNQVKIVYGGTITPDNDTFYPEIGLRGPDNTFATNINNRRVVAATGAWLNSTAGTNNTSSCYFNAATPGTVPAAGTTFTWTPPAVDMQASALTAPGTGGCYGANQTVSVTIRNTGGSTINFATTPVTVNCNVTGPNPTSFTPVVVNTGTLATNATQVVTFSTTYNMTTAGIYTFNASTTTAGDPYISNNTMTPAVRESHTPSIVASNDVAICTGSSTNLTSTGTSYPYTLVLSNTTPLAIPDDTPAGVNSTIVVTGAPVNASTVTVRIDNLSHTFDGDLILKLTAPNGTSILLSNQEGGAGANFVNTVFSSSAVTPIASGIAPFTGSFLPEDLFSTLTGNANGTWTLNVSDNAGADVGALQGWTLMFPITNSIATYSWGPAAGLSSTTITNPVANPTTTTTYTLTVTDASGCANTENVVVTVNPLPTVTANSTAAAVCTGGSVTLTGGGATTYTWTGGVTNGVSFVPASTLTYTVTGTNSNGCVNTASTTVTVNPLPTVTANSTATAVCAGGSVTLTGGGATSYTWTGGVTNGVAFVPPSTNSYTVTGTNVNGCVNTATISVTVNPLPTVTANSTAASVCTGGSVTLTGGGATTYTWTGGVTNGVAFVPASTLTYTLTGTNGNGCQNTASTTVTVNPLPTVTANSTAASVCTGGSVTLTGGGATTYTWSGGVTNGVAFVPVSTLTYTVTGTNGNGCQNTASTTVTVNPLPTVTANSTAASVCAGGSVTLTGGGATTYTWTGGVTNGVAFVPASTLTYTVTGTNGNGCQNTASTTVTVNPLPTVTANSTAASVCTGGSVTLTGGGATTYTWSGGVTNGVAFVPVSTLTYTVTGTNGNGCQNTASTTVTVNPLPTVTANSTATAVCIGGSVTLTGGGATTYTWTGGVTNGVAFVPPSTNSYTVTGTNSNGCVNTATISVTVNPLPTVTANSTATAVCTGSSVTLTGGGATTYTWTGGVTNGVAFVPPSTNSYTVTGTNGNGCVNTATISVTVNPLPTVTANSTATSVCTGNSVTLTGGGATTYTWSGGVTNGLAFVPPSTNSYTVTGTNGNGCVNTASVTVTVNPLPTVTANSTATAVCTGNSVTLTGGGATTYTWSGGVTNGIAFVPPSTNSYTVTGTNGNGCVNTASITVTVNPLPTVTANSTATAVCTGNSVTLTGGGATTYTWTGGVINNVAFVPPSTNSYTVTGTNGNGCVNTATISVTVNPLPTVTATSTAAAVCAGNSVTLNGGGATTYTWTGGVTDNLAFTPVSTLNYTVTGTDGNGCQNTASTMVTVNALPTVTANSTAAAVCDGSSVTLTGGGATSYAWTGSVTDGVSFVPVSTLTYTVTGTDGNGCVNTASTTVTVNALPTVTANSTATAVCDGSSVTLNGGGATSYTWTGGVIDNVAFTPTITDTYTVTGTDANGCFNTASTTVTVNALPTVTVSSTASAVCDGSSVTLMGGGATSYAWTGGVTDAVPFVPTTTDTYTVTGTDGNGCTNVATVTVSVNPVPVVDLGPDMAQCSGSVVLDAQNAGSTYMWSDNSTGQTLTAATTGTYWVDVTNASGCTVRDSAVITINSTPVVALGADITQCGGTVTIDAGNAGATYLWNDNSTNQTLTVSAGGIYSVVATLAGGCTATDTIMVTINTPPVVTVTFPMDTVCFNGGMVNLSGETPAGGTWNGTGVSGSSFDPQTAGLGWQMITYSFTDVNGCTTSLTDSLNVDVCNGVAPVAFGSMQISAYPNPNNGIFTLNIANSDVSEMNLAVTDLEGRIVYSEMLTGTTGNFNKQIDLSVFANGTYFVKVMSGSEMKILKVIKSE